jgi:hypothetical protein
MTLQTLTLEGITSQRYQSVIDLLTLARDQRAKIERGEEGAASECALCGDAHLDNECRKNPLLLMTIGEEALTGNVWKCYHCNAIFTDVESASRHFGDMVEIAVGCIRLAKTPGADRIRTFIARTLAGDQTRAEFRRCLELIQTIAQPNDAEDEVLQELRDSLASIQRGQVADDHFVKISNAVARIDELFALPGQ